MSGGSYQYAYFKLQELADAIMSKRPNCALSMAMAKQLNLFADAAHDIEWVDSGDYGAGREMDAIKKALGPDWGAACVEVLQEQVDLINKQLQEIRNEQG